jgi:hypothetical protein
MVQLNIGQRPLRPADIPDLQRSLGNGAVQRMLQDQGHSAAPGAVVQRDPEDIPNADKGVIVKASLALWQAGNEWKAVKKQTKVKAPLKTGGGVLGNLRKMNKTIRSQNGTAASQQAIVQAMLAVGPKLNEDHNRMVTQLAAKMDQKYGEWQYMEKMFGDEVIVPGQQYDEKRLKDLKMTEAAKNNWLQQRAGLRNYTDVLNELLESLNTLTVQAQQSLDHALYVRNQFRNKFEDDWPPKG